MTTSKLARVVLWMVGALLSFSVMAVSIRELAEAGLSIFEILAIRSGVALLVLLVLLAVRPDLRVHALPRRMGLNLLRNTVHYASQYAWALSLTMLPLATVFALEFTMPAWTALLAVWLLHEQHDAEPDRRRRVRLDRRAGDPAARHRQLQSRRRFSCWWRHSATPSP